MCNNKKCPDCGNDNRHLLTIRKEKVIFCHKCDYSSCPECESELNELIGYVYGHKTCDGLSCTECDWKEEW